MKHKLFEEYATIKSQLLDLQLQEVKIKEAIIADMQKDNLNKIENDFGKFTVSTRTTYSYSEKIDDLNEKIKLAKHKEEEKGIATIKTQTPYIVWTGIKEI